MRIASFVPAASEWLDTFGASDVVDAAAEGLGGERLGEFDLVIVEHPVAVEVRPPTKVVRFSPRTFKEVLDGALHLAHLAGVLPAAMRFIGEREARLHRLREQIAEEQTARPRSPAPSVLVLRSLSPIESVGRWEADLVELAGGRAGARRSVDRTPLQGMAALREVDPDVLVIATAGRGQDGQLMDALESDEDWLGLKAARQRRVWLMDGTRYATAATPLLYRSVELLAAALHGPTLSLTAAPDELRRIDAEVPA